METDIKLSKQQQKSKETKERIFQAAKDILQKNGYEIVDFSQKSDIYIINTCTVTGLADRKSRQYIRKMKKTNPESVVAVTGCYAQISPDEVQAVEGVNIVSGTNEKGKLIDYIENFFVERLPQMHVLPYEELKTYEYVNKIPTTSTGKVRRELQELVRTDFKYRRIVGRAINTDPHVYNMLQDAFMGGYTHANWIYTDEIIKDVDLYEHLSEYDLILIGTNRSSRKWV